jgi:hypothetical protein
MLVLAGVTAAGTIALSAADHRDGPIFCCSTVPVRSDLNDIYVFKSQPHCLPARHELLQRR